MLRKHSVIVAMLDRDPQISYLIRDYFDLPRHLSLLSALYERGLGQADLVLALLRFRDQRTSIANLFSIYIELLIGHPVQVCPACLTRYRDREPYIPQPQRTPDDRRITFVASGNPRLPNSEAFMQWREYRVGRTIKQLIVRGITKRDIRRLIKRGWIKVEEHA